MRKVVEFDLIDDKLEPRAETDTIQINVFGTFNH